MAFELGFSFVNGLKLGIEYLGETDEDDEDDIDHAIVVDLFLVRFMLVWFKTED